jgi:hypothetical protein
LDAETQLRSAQHTIEPRAAEPTASDAIDRSLEQTFPASDPPASHRADEPPANADAKWKAAGATRTGSASLQAKSAQGKPSAKPRG